MSTKTCRRVWLKGRAGSLVLVAPPYPEVGDLLTIQGKDYPVRKIREDKVVAEFSTVGGKLKQVFP